MDPNNQNNQSNPNNFANVTDMPDSTAQFDPNDIAQNKVMAILGYICFLIPMLAAKESRFAQFHANQGLVTLILYVISSVLWAIPVLGWILAPICYVASCVFSILGIINAAGGKAKQLPLIGGISILK